MADVMSEIPSRKVMVSSVPKFTLVVDVVCDISENDENAYERVPRVCLTMRGFERHPRYHKKSYSEKQYSEQF